MSFPNPVNSNSGSKAQFHELPHAKPSGGSQPVPNQSMSSTTQRVSTVQGSISNLSFHELPETKRPIYSSPPLPRSDYPNSSHFPIVLPSGVMPAGRPLSTVRPQTSDSRFHDLPETKHPRHSSFNPQGSFTQGVHPNPIREEHPVSAHYGQAPNRPNPVRDEKKTSHRRFSDLNSTHRY